MMRYRCLTKIIVFVCLGLSTLSFKAQGDNFVSKVKGILDSSDNKKKSLSTPEDLYELTLDENLAEPNVGKYSDIIKGYQKKQAIAIKKAGYKTELTRNGEIIIASIPSGELFLPEDSIITEKGKNKLKQFIKYLDVPDFYRVLLVMHSDNTGISRYTYMLSRSRVEAILSWFDTNNANTDYVIPYAMGATMPLLPNNTLENRYGNRRLEIYLVPGLEMINKAKKGEL